CLCLSRKPGGRSLNLKPLLNLTFTYPTLILNLTSILNLTFIYPTLILNLTSLLNLTFTYPTLILTLTQTSMLPGDAWACLGMPGLAWACQQSSIINPLLTSLFSSYLSLL